MSIQSDKALEEALKLIESCSFKQPLELLKEILKGELGNKRIVFAIKCCRFWLEADSSTVGNTYFEQGEWLLFQWKKFQIILEFAEPDCEKIIYAFKKAIFSKALEIYSKATDGKDPKLKAEILRKTGLCYKKLGSYEMALKFLTEANSTVPGQAQLIAEMADCYAFYGETKNAKMLFREAFFMDARKIDLTFLDSPLIRVLIEKVEDAGYTGAALLEWIPVYGVIFGIFNIKRQMKSQEVLRLNQEIYSKQGEMKDPASNKELLKPRLINLYFWLIDYYILDKDSISKINEVLLKLKLLDPEIHKLYVR
ncbi:MAG: tetratricopeptide repeat protein [Treponema sp.]|nr:tetratricopeptide repeat protein [Spirochaetia bacterium]MDD7458813.1 tetratricopeptide repeat protein [Spirochaetales bacterium]MDY5811946.1 tetratricopeptide repeat protein [Treponema sp.]MEE1182294.1 tetratricopeptide repeat protein [Treponema sp.]